MIVVDTNVIAYFHINNRKYTGLAHILYAQDPTWIAPYLWKSEFRNILKLYLQKQLLKFSDCMLIMQKAELLMGGGEHKVNSFEVLKLATESNCTAYDCEFVSLAKKMKLKLYTLDKQLLTAFPDIAISLEAIDNNIH